MSTTAPRHGRRLAAVDSGAADPDHGLSTRAGSPAGDRAECDGAGRVLGDAEAGCAAACPPPKPPSRRRFLVGAGGIATALGLAACSDVHSGSADPRGGSTGPTQQAGSKVGSLAGVTGTLTFAFWGGSPGEQRGFEYAKKQFEARHPGATVTLNKLPFDGFFAGIDRGLQAGNAPDVFRVDYTNVGKYSAGGALLDVTPYFSTAEVGEYLEPLWKAITYRGVPYGLPHQTDVTAIVYDRAALAAAGVHDVPERLEQAWTWEQFGAVAARLRAALPAEKYPFAYDWTKAGAYRWFSWLYQAGGRVMNPDRTASALTSDAAVKALDLTTSFFAKKWVPPTNTIKGSTYSDAYFLAGTVPMAFVGSFVLPNIGDPTGGFKGEWGVAPMPRDAGAATDLGGNAVVVNAKTKNPDLAAAFLRILGSEDCMRYFCEQSIELPSRKKLVASKLDYAVAPEKVQVFARQATTLSDLITGECSHPAFNKINTSLQENLERAFTSGGDSRATLQALAADVDAALR